MNGNAITITILMTNKKWLGTHYYCYSATHSLFSVISSEYVVLSHHYHSQDDEHKLSILVIVDF